MHSVPGSPTVSWLCSSNLIWALQTVGYLRDQYASASTASSCLAAHQRNDYEASALQPVAYLTSQLASCLINHTKCIAEHEDCPSREVEKFQRCCRYPTYPANRPAIKHDKPNITSEDINRQPAADVVSEVVFFYPYNLLSFCTTMHIMDPCTHHDRGV